MSHDLPEEDETVNTKNCQADLGGERSSVLRTTVSLESETLCNAATEGKPDSPGMASDRSKPLGGSPSPKFKRDVSMEASSPKVKKSHVPLSEVKKSIASPAESSTPKLTESTLAPETSSPEKHRAASPTEAANSTPEAASPSEKSKRRKGKKGGGSLKRKERKRGMSTSSSDDPKTPCSESAGSEAADQGLVIAGCCEGAVESQESGVDSGAFSTRQEEGVDHMGKGVFCNLATPTETPSPTIRSKEFAKKKGSGKKRRHGSNRERGLSSSSDDPKSSHSQTVSLESEVAGCQVAPSMDSTIVTGMPVDDGCFTEIPRVDVACSGGAAAGLPVKCQLPVKCLVSVTDYDHAVDFSEC